MHKRRRGFTVFAILTWACIQYTFVYTTYNNKAQYAHEATGDAHLIAIYNNNMCNVNMSLCDVHI